jgi:hypothetical protein
MAAPSFNISGDTVRRHFALRDVAQWCARVQRNASDGRRIKTFVVRGEEREEQVTATFRVDGGKRRKVAL